MAGRRCPGKGCPTIIPAGTRYCPPHARAYEARRGTPAARGYDAAHRAERALWQGRIDSGTPVHCVTCGVRLYGRAWDLGHTPERTAYIGPQCAPCNRGEGGREGRARQT